MHTTGKEQPDTHRHAHITGALSGEVTYPLIALCAHRPVGTIQRRATTDRSFPNPIGSRALQPRGRPFLIFDAAEVRDWLKQEVKALRLDPAVLTRYDWLIGYPEEDVQNP